MTTVTALLPVYHAANADHLRVALASLEDQTRRADELVITCDGPLGSELESVLDECPEAVVVRSQRHEGLGPALRRGLEAAAGEWIARCDADDISEATRLEKQVARVARADVDVVGAAMLEFSGDGTHTGVRRMPETHEEIVRVLRWSNPINHPTVLARRSAVLAAHNYRDVPYLEDYDLWVRMIANGARVHNLPEPLVRFRGDDHLSRRRLNAAMARSELTVHRELVAAGLGPRPPLSWARLPLRVGFSLLPARLMQGPYRRMFLSGREGPASQATS